MLGFCNNAGPAFLFGVGGLLFQNIWVVLILWFIQILSSILTAAILPGRNCEMRRISEQRSYITANNILKNATLSIATVCGWVILFRVMISILDQWLIGMVPLLCKILLYGSIELTNGFDGLFLLDNNSLKCVLANLFLTGGGLCVWLQTIGVIGNLDSGMFFKGKIIQCCISVPIGLIFAGLLYCLNYRYIIMGAGLIFLDILGYLILKNRKKDWKKGMSSCTI
jgi:hypothetical protein